MSLHVYLDGHWQTHSQHPEIGGGTWNRRPAPQWTLWRIRNNQQITARLGMGMGMGWVGPVDLPLRWWMLTWNAEKSLDFHGETLGHGMTSTAFPRASQGQWQIHELRAYRVRGLAGGNSTGGMNS